MTSACIETTRARNTGGYGVVKIKGRQLLHHRVAYVQRHNLKIEDIDGVIIRHGCDNPACINPEHLVPGTHADNTSDKVARGRQYKGTAQHNAKLDYDKATLIRQQYTAGGITQRKLAANWGVSQTVIANIIHLRYWKPQ